MRVAGDLPVAHYVSQHPTVIQVTVPFAEGKLISMIQPQPVTHVERRQPALGFKVEKILRHRLASRHASRPTHTRRIIDRLGEGVVGAHGKAVMELAAKADLEAVVNGRRPGGLVFELKRPELAARRQA